MIPATTPYVASYSHTHEHPDGRKVTYFTEKDVIAWDDDGEALVADEKTGRLRLASSYSNFHSVGRPTPSVVAAISGGGWRAQYKDDDGTRHTSPVLYWAVREDGSCVGMDIDVQGYIDDAKTADNFVRFLRPEEAP